MGLDPYDLNLAALGMHAGASSRAFASLDKFSLKYNPMGKSAVGRLFLQHDNLLHGRYFAELTRELFDNLEECKYQNSEYRLTLFGVERDEWDRLAAWVVDHQLYSPNNRWIVQVPRLYGLYHAKGKVLSFEQMLANIFEPLFETAADPSSHYKLHLFLQQVCACVCVCVHLRDVRMCVCCVCCVSVYKPLLQQVRFFEASHTPLRSLPHRSHTLTHPYATLRALRSSPSTVWETSRARKAHCPRRSAPRQLRPSGRAATRTSPTTATTCTPTYTCSTAFALCRGCTRSAFGRTLARQGSSTTCTPHTSPRGASATDSAFAARPRCSISTT